MYSVLFYKNNILNNKLENLTDVDASRMATINGSSDRWHVMMQAEIVNRLEPLFVGEALCVAWQDYRANLASCHIIIQRLPLKLRTPY